MYSESSFSRASFYIISSALLPLPLNLINFKCVFFYHSFKCSPPYFNEFHRAFIIFPFNPQLIFIFLAMKILLWKDSSTSFHHQQWHRQNISSFEKEKFSSSKNSAALCSRWGCSTQFGSASWTSSRKLRSERKIRATLVKFFRNFRCFCADMKVYLRSWDAFEWWFKVVLHSPCFNIAWQSKGNKGNQNFLFQIVELSIAILVVKSLVNSW